MFLPTVPASAPFSRSTPNNYNNVIHHPPQTMHLTTVTNENQALARRACYSCSFLSIGSKCVRSVQQTKKVTSDPLIYIPAPLSTPPLCPPPHLTIFYFEMIKSRDVTMETG